MLNVDINVRRFISHSDTPGSDTGVSADMTVSADDNVIPVCVWASLRVDSAVDSCGMTPKKIMPELQE